MKKRERERNLGESRKVRKEDEGSILFVFPRAVSRVFFGTTKLRELVILDHFEICRTKDYNRRLSGGSRRLIATRLWHRWSIPGLKSRNSTTRVHAPLGGYVLPFQRESSFGRAILTTPRTTSIRVLTFLRLGSRARQAILTKRGSSPQLVPTEEAGSSANGRHIRYAIVHQASPQHGATAKKNPFRDARQGPATLPSPLRSRTMTIGHGDR